jgi:hypothetical protein
MGRIWNDGFEKLKGKRVEATGSQLPEILDCFTKFLRMQKFSLPIATTIEANNVINGQEFSPQQWLPQPQISSKEHNLQQHNLIMSLFQTISAIPNIADEVLEDFTDAWANLPVFPLNKTLPVSDFLG